MNGQIITGGIFIPWHELDKAIAAWCKKQTNGTWNAIGGRDGSSLLINLYANRAGEGQGKDLIIPLYEKYDTEHAYELDPDDDSEILPEVVALGIMNEIFVKSRIRLEAQTVVATYDGVFFLENEIMF